MKIHEFQAKEILRRYGVVTPRGRVTQDAGEAAAICEELSSLGSLAPSEARKPWPWA